MSTKLSAGKIAGLKAVSNQHGVIAAAAMDQRGLLEQMLSRALGGGVPPAGMISEFKEIDLADEISIRP